MPEETIVLAGGTGGLGTEIAEELVAKGARVRALVRSASDPGDIAKLERIGAEPVAVDFASQAELVSACRGAGCVVSALSGLRDVIVGLQGAILDAAVEAGVPRFIPSDFAVDFPKLPYGGNRNFDLRREFLDRIESAPIAATSILNGAFAELLVGPAPIVVFPIRRVVYWDDADQRLDFTARRDVAEFTAAAALDPDTPRFLRIAGDVVSACDLVRIASEATGEEFRLFRAGGLNRLDLIIRIVRKLHPAEDSVFPPWQGMQYVRDMFDGRGKLEPLDNARYPGIEWTSVKQVIQAR